MDADDVAMPHRFEVELPLMQDADIVGAGLLEFVADTDDIVGQRVPPTEPGQIVRYARMHDPFNHPTVVYRRSAVHAAGGYGELRLMEDYALFARMLAGGARAVNVAEPLVFYRVGPEAFKRRGGTGLLRSELRLQREFRRRRFTSRAEFARNVLVRGGYRLIPWWCRRALYKPAVAHFAERLERGHPAPAQPSGWENPDEQGYPEIPRGRVLARAAAAGALVNVDLVIVGSGFFGLTVAERCARDLGLRVLILERRAAHRRERLQRAGTRDRDRDPPVRRAPVPHLERQGVGVRQPVHRLHRLPAPGVLGLQGPGLPAADQPGHDVRVLRHRAVPGRGARAGRRAVRRGAARPRGQPGAEGHLADRPAAVRGVLSAATRSSSGRPTRPTCPRRSSRGCRCGTRSTTATSATRSRACRSTGTPPGWSAWPTTRNIEVRLNTDFARLRSDVVGQVPWCTPGRSTSTSATKRAT